MRGVANGLLCAWFLCSAVAIADHPDEDDHEQSVLSTVLPAQVVAYPAAFFQRYQPSTALDMVNQVPGFQLDNGDDSRGFTTAAGNILINNQRPSVKQDTPASMLGRIPAGNVVRIDLIRGQTTGVDLQGQQVVVNIVLHDESPAAVRWDAFVYKNSENDVIMPGGSISLSDRWSNIDVNTGIGGDRHAHSSIGSRNSYDADGNLSEDRSNDVLNKHLTVSANLNASTWIGKTLLQLNTEVGYDKVDETLTADRVPQNGVDEPFHEDIVDDRESDKYEIGVSAERALKDDLTGKGILIFIGDDFNEVSSQRVLDNTNTQTLFRLSDTNTETTEAIARMEFDWTGIANHQIQFNMEGAFNTLEGSLLQTVDTGSGPVVEDVPGANTRVEEERIDVLLSDTWRVGAFELNYGIGAEISTLTQTGDAELERDFTFVKPHAILSHSPEQGRQTRFRMAREVSQLDFNDFVSASVFQDDDLALGNPNLSPETTWIAELTHERRFGDISVVKLRAYHHWISDVEDLLPLTPTFEAPGNIGDGRRWGIEVEGTAPLDRLGLKSARLDIKARWQDSSVVDPVTGEDRVLSSAGRISSRIPFDDIDVRYMATIDLRQDFEPQRIAWGLGIITRAERPLFKVNELDVFDEGTIISAFVETTRWLGLKIRLQANDLLNESKTRTRTLYTAERGISPVARYEITDVTRGRQFELVLIGSF
ncbi:MAG: TonB-dependent receptor [Gammaproteobacteria bacterium]|nr:TonB-dependent receptor [Gammaproteobacteria bacterium]